MISIATMGKFWPQEGYGLPPVKGIGGAGGGIEYIKEKRPIVRVDRIHENDEKITVTVIGVDEW